MNYPITAALVAGFLFSHAGVAHAGPCYYSRGPDGRAMGPMCGAPPGSMQPYERGELPPYMPEDAPPPLAYAPPGPPLVPQAAAAQNNAQIAALR